MTDEKRAAPDNGIWLCRNCAKMIDDDEDTYTAEVLLQWKGWREQESAEGTSADIPIGRLIEQSGPGVGFQIDHEGPGPAEEIELEGGRGIGEAIISTGGTGKLIRSRGGTGSKVSVRVTEPTVNASGLMVGVVACRCDSCGTTFQVSYSFSGMIGTPPDLTARCPRCGATAVVKTPDR